MEVHGYSWVEVGGVIACHGFPHAPHPLACPRLPVRGARGPPAPLPGGPPQRGDRAHASYREGGGCVCGPTPLPVPMACPTDTSSGMRAPRRVQVWDAPPLHWGWASGRVIRGTVDGRVRASPGGWCTANVKKPRRGVVGAFPSPLMVEAARPDRIDFPGPTDPPTLTPPNLRQSPPTFPPSMFNKLAY